MTNKRFYIFLYLIIAKKDKTIMGQSFTAVKGILKISNTCSTITLLTKYYRIF